MKLLRFVWAYLKTLWLLLTHRYDLCYLAITCHGIGFLKDAPFVWLCKLFGCKVLIHQHNKGMSKCIDRWPYRWLIPYIYKRTRVMLLSWYLYPDIEKAVRREQVVICPNGIAAEQQVNCDDSLVNAACAVNVALPRLNAAEQQVNCDDSQVNAPCAVNVALPRLKAAEQQVNSDESQVKSCVAAVKGDGREVNQSQGDDSPATTLRFTSSTAAINRSEAASLTAHRSPLTVNLLFLSNLIPSKGVYVLLDACRILKDKGLDFQCNFVGGETKEIDRARFEAEVQKRGLEGMVRYEGPKYGKEKEEYWRSSDVFVFPTYYFNECFPLVILEAMQHGLPVVSTDEGAVPDIVADGENGFVCRRKDAEGLAQALERLLQDEALRHRMGAEGYRRYKENFTLQCFEQRLAECLRRG
jgi:glycosyltransferase involved in cell wall biosynthesis